MKNKKKILVIMVALLFAGMIFSTISYAAETKKGMYAVEGYKIKSITKSGNKVKVVTRHGSDMTTVRGEYLKYLKGKTHTFNLDKNVKYKFQYYNSKNIKKTTWSKIKKAIKISNKYKGVYESEEDDSFSTFDSSDYPRLYLTVNKKGKVTEIVYSEGKLDILSHS